MMISDVFQGPFASPGWEYAICLKDNEILIVVTD